MHEIAAYSGQRLARLGFLLIGMSSLLRHFS
jgi:hypothetical protein